MRDGGAAASRNRQLERLVNDKTLQKEAEGGSVFYLFFRIVRCFARLTRVTLISC